VQCEVQREVDAKQRREVLQELGYERMPVAWVFVVVNSGKHLDEIFNVESGVDAVLLST
jgi:hypothetical protein